MVSLRYDQEAELICATAAAEIFGKILIWLLCDIFRVCGDASLLLGILHFHDIL